MKLYFFPVAPNPTKVALFLEEANLPYEALAIDTRKPERKNWTEIVAEAAEPLQSVDLVNNLLVCSYLKDVTTKVKLYTMDGRYLRDVEFPGLGTASGFGGKRTDTETFYSFSSFATPPSTYRYDMVTGEALMRLASDHSTTYTAAWSPDGKRIVSGHLDGAHLLAV